MHRTDNQLQHCDPFVIFVSELVLFTKRFNRVAHEVLGNQQGFLAVLGVVLATLLDQVSLSLRWQKACPGPDIMLQRHRTSLLCLSPSKVIIYSGFGRHGMIRTVLPRSRTSGEASGHAVSNSLVTAGKNSPCAINNEELWHTMCVTAFAKRTHALPHARRPSNDWICLKVAVDSICACLRGFSAAQTGLLP